MVSWVGCGWALSYEKESLLCAVWTALHMVCSVQPDGEVLVGGRGVTYVWKLGHRDPFPPLAGSHLRAFMCGDESVLDLVQTFLGLLGILDEGQVLFLHLHENRQQLLGISKIQLRLLEWKTHIMSFCPPLASFPLNYMEVGLHQPWLLECSPMQRGPWVSTYKCLPPSWRVCSLTLPQ